jgi:hypothetical protein
MRPGYTLCSGRARQLVFLPRNWPGRVSRSGRCPGTGQSRWLGGIDWQAAEAEVAADAAKGASVVYQCIDAAYTQWLERFPLLQPGALAAC